MSEETKNKEETTEEKKVEQAPETAEPAKEPEVREEPAKEEAKPSELDTVKEQLAKEEAERKAAGIESSLPSPRLLPDYTRKTKTL